MNATSLRIRRLPFGSASPRLIWISFLPLGGVCLLFIRIGCVVGSVTGFHFAGVCCAVGGFTGFRLRWVFSPPNSRSNPFAILAMGVQPTKPTRTIAELSNGFSYAALSTNLGVRIFDSHCGLLTVHGG